MPRTTRTTKGIDKLAEITHRELVAVRKAMATKSDVAMLRKETATEFEVLREEMRTGFRDNLAAMEALLEKQMEKIEAVLALEERVGRIEHHLHLNK